MVLVTPLEFDTHDLLTAQDKREYNALPHKANPDSKTPGSEQFNVQNHVVFQDYREVTDHKYKLQAQLSTEFSTGTKAIDGAELLYQKTWLSLQDSNGTSPAGLAPSVTLSNDGLTPLTRLH
ncbi:hypothetical protein GQR36_18655 [Enterococcus termitis]